MELLAGVRLCWSPAPMHLIYFSRNTRGLRKRLLVSHPYFSEWLPGGFRNERYSFGRYGERCVSCFGGVAGCSDWPVVGRRRRLEAAAPEMRRVDTQVCCCSIHIRVGLEDRRIGMVSIV